MRRIVLRLFSVSDRHMVKVRSRRSKRHNGGFSRNLPRLQVAEYYLDLRQQGKQEFLSWQLCLALSRTTQET